jgi:hypothetical protein
MAEGVRTLRTLEDGPRRFVLRERDGFLELLSGPVVLLSSAALETERTFGRLAERPDGSGPRTVLVGGLGFGMTVRGVLDVVGPDASITVAEKVDAVERLVRGDLAHLASDPLRDNRVRVVPRDVGDVIAGFGERAVDAILLDVDNGPHWASFRSNARLYTASGVAAARRILAPGGFLAVWSGYPADAFLSTLREGGLEPSLVPLHERGRVRARAYVGRRGRAGS